MGFGDMVNKGKDALNSDKGEEMSDNALDKAGDIANDKTGNKFGDQIQQGHDAADSQVGNE